ncbi:class I SAM-dependent methyltransferase [Fodinicola feengrottensis]|uniref:Methyltransferase type 11 domain-containing protein n=1 Tax=Fodinicola feengrottensis TaxID=435914 RepID=A0ABN2HL49_9ACTN|nr:class I SAM-dependent methyltransferase [Fodinicola feengrottensis]
MIQTQIAYVTEHLPEPVRLLDAGCGSGDLAAALTARGYDVTAIDIDPNAVASARSKGVAAFVADIADYDNQPFDAVLFSFSLHHVDRLDAAIERTRDLLKAGGTLLADEFAWERADAKTAGWFYDIRVLLGKAGALEGHQDEDPVVEPLRKWQHRHGVEDPMHPGEQLVKAIRRHFDLVESSPAPYLHRYINPTDQSVFAALKEIEHHQVSTGAIAEVGLRLRALPASPLTGQSS